VIRALANRRGELGEMGVRYLAVFGSVARDEAGADSDIDILADLERPAGLLKYARLEHYLESLLGREVDLVPYDSVRSDLKGRIFREAVRVL
jgi:predicted nucleotidyltransferase